jgi:hypothetical protein
MILICYDGSEDAKSAIHHAGTLLPGSPATVLTVWEPYITILTRTPGGMGPVAGVVDIEELDKGSREAAEREAAEGAALAHDAGIARPRPTGRLRGHRRSLTRGLRATPGKASRVCRRNGVGPPRLLAMVLRSGSTSPWGSRWLQRWDCGVRPAKRSRRRAPAIRGRGTGRRCRARADQERTAR